MKYTTSSVSSYNKSFAKKVINKLLAALFLVMTSPLMLLIVIAIYLEDQKPLIFKQIRTGFRGKLFTILKFRTMIKNAEGAKNKYQHLNVSDGPTFKIPNDPRFTRLGKILAKSGLDELPQLLNVLKGEMSLVGPRPLPLYEAKKLTKRQKIRELVLPGITSSWVVSGAHRLKFQKWMELDKEYVQNATLLTDLIILFKTAKIIISIGIRKLLRVLKNPRT